MKKAMMAAACVAACTAAQAQSNVQLMGLADVYVGAMRMAGDTQRTNLVGSGGMTTSWWGMKASEDLGGGLKVDAAFTGFMRMTTGAAGRFDGDPMLSRDANVSISGGFGSVLAGRAMAPNFLPTVVFNPMGDSFTFSPLILHSDVNLSGGRFTRNNPSDTGYSSQIRYSTPKMGGLTGTVSYQLSGISGKKNYGGNLMYFSGPIGLTAYYERDQLTNPNAAAFADGATRKVWMLGGSYDAQVVKGFMTYGEADLSSTVKQKTWTLGASAPMGANGKLLAAYANSKPEGGNKRQTLTVGYDYNLSKRTDVYTMLMSDKIATKTSGTSFGVGVRHRF